MSSTHTVELDQIVVQQRHRRDLGDLKSLAKSIEDVGLLQPVVLTSDSLLIAGERRLAAVRMLGWSEIPAFYVSTVSDAASLLRAERDENTCRKPLTPTEEHSLYEALLALERPKARERKAQASGQPQGSKKVSQENFSGQTGKARAAAAEAATGKAGRFATLDKVGEVKKIASDESTPEPVKKVASDALEEMDKTGKIDGAYRRVKDEVAAQKLLEESSGVTEWVEGSKSVQDARYMHEVYKALGRTWKLMQFDPERVGLLARPEDIASFDNLLQSLTVFVDKLKKSRSTLRVIEGGKT